MKRLLFQTVLFDYDDYDDDDGHAIAFVMGHMCHV